jgi:hypothetical protein
MQAGRRIVAEKPVLRRKPRPGANLGAQTMHVGAADFSVLDKKSADRQAEPTHDRRRQKAED